MRTAGVVSCGNLWHISAATCSFEFSFDFSLTSIIPSQTWPEDWREHHSPYCFYLKINVCTFSVGYLRKDFFDSPNATNRTRKAGSIERTSQFARPKRSIADSVLSQPEKLATMSDPVDLEAFCGAAADDTSAAICALKSVSGLHSLTLSFACGIMAVPRARKDPRIPQRPRIFG